MAKQQSSPIAKAARLLDLVPYISTHQGVSVKSLASEFGVSVDELLDDLNTLWMCGLPGYTPLELIDLSFDSGYVSIRNAEVLQRVRLLTKEELVVIAIGLDLLKESISEDRTDLASAITSLATKIKSLIGDVVSVSPNVDSAHRALILRALKERRDLKVKYHSLIRDEISERRITPIELGSDNGLETLFAYCSKAKAFRTFRLDNFIDAEISEASAEVANRKSVTDLYTAKFRISGRLRTTLERFRLPVAPYSIGAKDSIEVTSFSQDWLARNFLSTLGNTEIIDTPSLAKAVGDKASATLALYESKAFSLI